MALRWRGHVRLLERGEHHSPFLQNAWTKHGSEAFLCRALEYCDLGQLIAREQFYIDTLRPEFNVNPVAGSRLGSKMSAEHLARHRATLRALAALVTHCPKGHAYDDVNTYLSKKGKRVCRACNAERVSAIYASETPEQRERRMAQRKAHYLRTRDDQAAKRKAYAESRREQKREYDRINNAKATERQRKAFAAMTPEQRAAKNAYRMARYYKNRDAEILKMREYNARKRAERQDSA